MEVKPDQVRAQQFAQGAGDAAGVIRDAAAKIDELETEVSAARDEAEAALLLAQNAVPLHGPHLLQECICTQQAIDEAERVFDRLEDAVSDLINLSSQLESEADDLESIEF